MKNAARLSVLRARNDALSTLFASARSRLAGLGKGPKYEGLFRDLLLQALIKLSEPKVNVNVRKADLALAKKVIPGVVESYQTKTRSQVVVNLDEKRFLPPSPEEAGENAPSCCGGVVVSARKGKIMCSNTLDTRLEIAYEALLPDIRERMFDATQ